YQTHCACAAQGARRVAIASVLCPSDTANHRSRKEPKMSARSCCVQSQLITDHQGTDQCALMISVAPEVPAVSAHQCHINATCQCLPVHINATYQCPSELPFNATYQCQSVPPINAANQCHLSVPVSVPISASQCRLSVPVS
ncbi:unnamed protein product, partial [Staurois parvus]